MDDTTDGMMITKRIGDGMQVFIAAAIGGRECEYRFEGKRKDALTGKVYDGHIVLEPYEIAVLEEL